MVSTPRTPSPKLSIQDRRSILFRLRADWRGLFKGVAKGIGHVVAGKWEELGADAVEALAAMRIESDPSELASLLIRRSLVRALYDLIGENIAQRLPELHADHSTLESDIERRLSEVDLAIDRSFLDRPDALSIVTDLQNSLNEWLIYNGMTGSVSEAVVSRLPAYFVYALNHEWRAHSQQYQPILDALDTPFAKAGEREWAWSLYGSLLNRRLAEPIFDEPFSLSQLYVPLHAYCTDDRTATSALDTSKHRRRVRIVVGLDAELRQWVQGNENPIRVLSGGPGSGKSSFARIFAAELSRRGPCKVLFVPLHLIDPARDVADEVGRFVRDEGILPFNPLDQNGQERNLLIIFDGLDELASQGKAAAETARAFLRQVEKLVDARNLHGTRLRVLISGREVVVQESESEFRRPRQVLSLLPYMVSEEEKMGALDGYDDPQGLLSNDLRREWWKRYSALSGSTFEGINELLTRSDLHELTGQPLLNYLLALSLTRGKLDLSGTVNLNVIYSDLVAAVYERGYERKGPYAPIRHLSREQFMRILEEVGLAAWHGDGRSTTIPEIEEHCRQSGVGGLLDAFQEGAKAGVTRLLAAFFFRKHGERVSGDPTFVFTHKSFGEYLAACRVIRATERMVRERRRRQDDPDDGWDERETLVHWVQVCGATAITTYLHTFLLNEIALRSASDLKAWQSTLAGLFTYLLRAGLPMEQSKPGSFRDALFRSRNAEEALLVVLNGCARATGVISDVEHVDRTAFGAWFRRVQGQRTGPETSLVARCLSYLNLEGTYLDIADLHHANLRQSNLRGIAANLGCFERADLSGADLSGAELWSASFRDAMLTGARFDGANLQGVRFTNAKLDRVSFVGATTDRSTLPKGVREAGRMVPSDEDETTTRDLIEAEVRSESARRSKAKAPEPGRETPRKEDADL